MKIFLSGSMKFAREMTETRDKLRVLGHDAVIPFGTEHHLKDAEFVDNLEDNMAWCIKHDVMRKCFEEVAGSDAILVLNYKRRGIDGNIGISALMEMGIAHYLRKKIFLLFPIPHFREHRWAHEVMIMQPVILNGDLKKIK